MLKLRNSLNRMEFVEDFEKNGKSLYNFLLELSNEKENMYYDVIQKIVNFESKLIRNWLNQLQIN